MNDQAKPFRDIFRKKAVDRFLNGMEADAPHAMNAWPLRATLATLAIIAITIIAWLQIL